MIESILPSGVRSAEQFGDVVGAFLFPEEESTIHCAVDERRREFTTARHCARIALAQLGVPPIAIPTLDRAPKWPQGFTGSLTHCPGYRAAAVAATHRYHSLGIDAEPNKPLPDQTIEIISSPAERRLLAKLPPSGVSWDRLLFSAKESTYKVWYTLAGRWLGFQDAEIHLNLSAGTFDVQLLVQGPPVEGRGLSHFRGHWMILNQLLITAITVPVTDHINQTSME